MAFRSEGTVLVLTFDGAHPVQSIQCPLPAQDARLLTAVRLEWFSLTTYLYSTTLPRSTRVLMLWWRAVSLERADAILRSSRRP